MLFWCKAWKGQNLGSQFKQFWLCSSEESPSLKSRNPGKHFGSQTYMQFWPVCSTSYPCNGKYSSFPTSVRHMVCIQPSSIPVYMYRLVFSTDLCACRCGAAAVCRAGAGYGRSRLCSAGPAPSCRSRRRAWRRSSAEALTPPCTRRQSSPPVVEWNQTGCIMVYA